MHVGKCGECAESVRGKGMLDCFQSPSKASQNIFQGRVGLMGLAVGERR